MKGQRAVGNSSIVIHRPVSSVGVVFWFGLGCGGCGGCASQGAANFLFCLTPACSGGGAVENKA